MEAEMSEATDTMTIGSLTIIERLRSPDATAPDKEAAVKRIKRLETAVFRYLADDFGCNGGAQIMFEKALYENAD
jgi:hypothetical protein